MNTIESLAAELAEKNLLIDALVADLSAARSAVARAERQHEWDTRLLAGCARLLDLPAARIAELVEAVEVAA